MIPYKLNTPRINLSFNIKLALILCLLSQGKSVIASVNFSPNPGDLTVNTYWSDSMSPTGNLYGTDSVFDYDFTSFDWNQMSNKEKLKECKRSFTNIANNCEDSARNKRQDDFRASLAATIYAAGATGGLGAGIVGSATLYYTESTFDDRMAGCNRIRRDGHQACEDKYGD